MFRIDVVVVIVCRWMSVDDSKMVLNVCASIYLTSNKSCLLSI